MLEAQTKPDRVSEPMSRSDRRLWQPDHVLVQRDLRSHPVVADILGRCRTEDVREVDLVDGHDDGELLVRTFGLSGDATRPKALFALARRSLLLVDSEELFQQMAAGETMHRRCFNFLKILPYTGTCPYNCAYCWFRDPVLVPRVNARFFDRLPGQLAGLREEGRVPTVFTFTHYKSDCLALDHLTGFARRAADLFENEPGFIVQFLSKAHYVDSLLDPPPQRGTIVTFSVNAPWISEKIDLGASSIAERLDAAKRLSEAGVPVMLRIDPMMVFEGWEEGYSSLADAILEHFTPEHITVGTPRFQNLAELEKVVDATLNQEARRFMATQQALMSVHKPGAPDADGEYRHYFSNMSVSYSDEVRLSLYRHMLDELEARDPDLSVGICEEPKEIWEALELPWLGDKSRDCSCNFIPRILRAGGAGLPVLS